MPEGNPTGIGEYLTVGAAAEYLGVSRSTLRNWDRAGKLKAVRHPINGYRLYRREVLTALLKSLIGKEGSIV
jgi:excisionase family DNA binding protein